MEMETHEAVLPQTIDVEVEAKAMLEHFNGNLPQGGGDMINVLHYCQNHPVLSTDSREWKTIYERANKMHRHANSQHRAPNVSGE